MDKKELKQDLLKRVKEAEGKDFKIKSKKLPEDYIDKLIKSNKRT